jgi:hypothetical protein
LAAGPGLERVDPSGKPLGSDLANLVYGPTILFYAIILVDHDGRPLAVAAAVYAFFIFAAWRKQLSGDFSIWPVIPRVALISGPTLLLIGIFLRAVSAPLAYWMLIPAGACTLLVMVAGFGIMLWRKTAVA